jgi:ABC-type phosphate transport system permease subunit
MAPNHDSQIGNMDAARDGLTSLISGTLVMSFGISMAAAAMLLAAGMWLERF